MAFERGANGAARRKQSILSNMLRGVSALALGAIAVGGPAYAQDAQEQNAQEENTEDEIVVTGIRSSLRSSRTTRSEKFSSANRAAIATPIRAPQSSGRSHPDARGRRPRH